MDKTKNFNWLFLLVQIEKFFCLLCFLSILIFFLTTRLIGNYVEQVLINCDSREGETKCNFKTFCWRYERGKTLCPKLHEKIRKCSQIYSCLKDPSSLIVQVPFDIINIFNKLHNQLSFLPHDTSIFLKETLVG